MKPKIYLDTSVISGPFDEEFSSHTRLLFDAIKKQHYEAFISSITLDELLPAPKHIKEYFQIIKNLFKILQLTNPAIDLAERYEVSGRFSNKSLADMQQIAIATVNDLDAIISWNFKHIVNFDRIKVYNQINQENGYNHIEILSPRSLVYE